MTRYSSLFQLTAEGLKVYTSVMRRELPETALDVNDPLYATPLDGTQPFEVIDFTSAKDMAKAICKSFDSRSPQDLAGNIGLWAWLTFVLIDVVFPIKNGLREFKAYHRWYPSAPNDWQKAQRHLVRMPTLLYGAFADDVDHLLCGKPTLGPEIREQLTSQQDMFTSNFQRACRMLYYDERSGSVKKGASSKRGPGAARRLAAVRLQLDVTWDMTDLSPERMIALLPPEFAQFTSREASA